MIDQNIKDYSQQLNKLGIHHKIVEHPELRTPIEVQGHLGLTLVDGLSTMIMRTGDSFVAIIRRDDCRLDFGKIKKILGTSNLRMANADEFKEITNLPLGAARVFNPGLLTLLDKKLFEKEYLTGGTGSFTCSFRYKSEDLKKIPGSKVADISLSNINKENTSSNTKRLTILTGITPSGSGETHIGNYFGMVMPFLELQKKASKLYFFIADLHALTTVQDKLQLQKNVENQVLSYLACGIDLNKVIFYRQSDIPMHTELQTILNNVTPLALIKRCHAYKDKLQKGVDEEQVNMGLFNYPILMAADILMYEPDYVPVGEDQKQHIEITRDIAQFFNKAFGQTFKLPDIYNIKETARLVGIDGKRKMSKSLGNYISVFADENIIKRQIMSCYTDSHRIHSTDPGRVEGNPIFIYHDLINQNKKEVSELKARYVRGKVADVEVKEKLFQALLMKFEKERAKYQELKSNPNKIAEILKEGAQKAREVASKKMLEVREKIGITNRYSFFKY